MTHDQVLFIRHKKKTYETLVYIGVNKRRVGHLLIEIPI